MGTIAVNKKASFDYQILERFEAGLVLLGHEVKSIKNGRGSLGGAYVNFKKGRLFLINANIPLYEKAGKREDYEATRDRALLFKKKEISYLLQKKQTQGLTLIPLKIYTKNGLIKLEIGLAQGKKKYDKREAIKKRDTDRKIRTLIKIGKRG